MNFLRARVIYSCVSMLESCLFSQLKVELPSLLVLYFLLFLCFYLLWEIFSRRGQKKNSDVFWKMSNVFWKNSDVLWESSEGSGKLMENSCRLWSISETVKRDDSMKHPQMPSKGIEKGKTSFQRGSAKNRLCEWKLHGICSKIVLSKIFLQFFCRKSW